MYCDHFPKIKLLLCVHSLPHLRAPQHVSLGDCLKDYVLIYCSILVKCGLFSTFASYQPFCISIHFPFLSPPWAYTDALLPVSISDRFPTNILQTLLHYSNVISRLILEIFLQFVSSLGGTLDCFPLKHMIYTSMAWFCQMSIFDSSVCQSSSGERSLKVWWNLWTSV